MSEAPVYQAPEYTVGMSAQEVRVLTDVDLTDGHLSTGTLHLLCEMASHNVLVSLYGDDDSSVGIHNDIWFWGDAALGELIHAEATIARIDGRKVLFNVFVRADTREIARGIHERKLVSRSAFMASLENV